MNFGDDVFLNPWPFMVELYEPAREAQVVPEFELFDLGHVAALHRLLDTCGLPYGGQGALRLRDSACRAACRARPQALVAGVQALPPEVTSWSATGIGRTHLPVLAAALSLGGHLRVGMEDNVVYARGRPVRSQRRAGRARRPARHGAAATADVHRAGPRPARAALVVTGRRAGGAWPAGGARVSAGAIGMAVAVVALLALAVLAAATAGPAPRDPGRPIAVSLDPSATPGPPPPETDDSLQGDSHARTLLSVEAPVQDLIVFGVLIVGALVTLLLRHRRARPDRVPPPGPGAALRAGPAAVADARPMLDRALAAAEQELTDPAHREPRDAVIACWLRLEEGAAAAGVPRLPAQTPTEFTATLLAGLLPGEPEQAALEDLRRLYAQARFGSSALDADAAQRALVALAAVRAGLLAAGPVPASLARVPGREPR